MNIKCPECKNEKFVVKYTEYDTTSQAINKNTGTTSAGISLFLRTDSTKENSRRK